MKKNYIYFVEYQPNCEERYIVFCSLSRKNCLDFIKSRTVSYHDYWNKNYSKIVYKPHELFVTKRSLDTFHQYG